MKRLALVLLVSVVFVPAWASAKTPGPDHLVIVSLPGITWSDLRDTTGLVALRPGARPVGALSARNASRAANIARSYLTLGAGDPAYALTKDPYTELGFEHDESFEGGEAAAAVARRSGHAARGDVVHAGVPVLRDIQRTRLYGAEVGALGGALRRAGVSRAVVSAADLAVRPSSPELRRSSVLALTDEEGVVDHGTLTGLLRADRVAPFGVSVDPDAFSAATERALASSRVVLVDTGETSRANEYVQSVARERVQAIRHAALRRADRVIGRVLAALGPRDTVFFIAPSGPTPPVFREHLAPMMASGYGFSTSSTWLTSATTRRDGMVVLSDVAPTILHLFGVKQPAAMVGTPIHVGGKRTTTTSPLVELDEASSVREHFASAAFWVISTLISVLAVLAFVVFLGRSERLYKPLVGFAYLCLAIFPAAHVIRALHFWVLGTLGAHMALYGLAVVIAVVAWRVPGPRWAGAVALMLLCAGLFATDIAMGGPLQLNGVFGHSPLVAGRFYGVSNPGYAILFCSALLGFTGLAELRGQRKLPWWTVFALILLIPVDGLPMTGADVGGLLAGVPAVAVTIALGRRIRIRWRTVFLFIALAIGVALALSFVDLLRPPEARTHLGRFAAVIASGDLHEIATIIHRKGAAALLSLTITRWTWFIPIGFAVLFLLLIRPRGVLREVLSRRPLLRSGLWGTLVAGALGFAVNDSGISIPALALAFVVPYFVLLAVDAVKPRRATEPSQALP